MKVRMLCMCISLMLMGQVFAAVEIELEVIKQIESSGDPLAFNARSGARGLYQITKICLKDFNQRNNDSYTMAEMYNPVKNEAVARWYIYKRIPQMLNYYDIPITVDSVLWAYNAGIGRVIKGELPSETVEYIRRYKRRVR